MIHMTSGYSLETFGARVALEKSMPQMLAALKALPPEPLTFVDFGIADGGTSLQFWQDVFSTLRKNNPHPIHLYGNDLPENPHNDLALHLEQLRQQVPELRAYIAPVSFYQQVVADNTMSVGFSATALHWLSRVPGLLTTHIHANSASEAERETFRKQALIDFEQLMLRRASELNNGGHLILVNLAEADDGQSLGKNHRDHAMFDYLDKLFRETLQEFQLPQQIAIDTAFQNYYKTKADFEEVLERPSLRDTFRILDHRIEHTPCPYRERFEQDRDAAAFGEGLMKTIRSWSRHTFLTALRQHDADLSVADSFYDRLAQRISDKPEDYSMDYIHSFLHLEKI